MPKFIEINEIIVNIDSILTITKTDKSIIITLKYESDINSIFLNTEDNTLQIFNKLKQVLEVKSITI